ncbi:MAG: alanine racemase [Candidatus Colwellbacteria bacterium]|jgi:alanine racemase|nr:alanine racemase [Candidatus Colwellbacteria bacterium]MCK9497606.1 alanine racemase [Candidatus Colwellbacteria bacterium]MDD3752416.1 alanine racemase [Candidatus Colwellbacteria bacterium]MDD4818801.1 alanine racemase [Candidatus Colwellbacteria bacterium]
MKYYPEDNRTWIEIDKSTAANNLMVIRSFTGNTPIYATVKSNAYGHGLSLFSKLMEENGVDGFCVDTVPEGVYLRDEGITKPILVLGYSLPEEWVEAKEKNITISISSLSSLEKICSMDNSPEFHLKVDTGMRRQGIFPEEAEKAASIINSSGKSLKGLFTHFSSAKDINYPAFSDRQLELFERTAASLAEKGITGFIKHVSATGGALISDKYHLDMVRVGIGLYGYYPSKELEIQLGDIGLKPVMRWKTAISEIKDAKKGDYVGYDLTEKILADTRIAVIPVGYWHGLPRALSGIAELLVNGKKCKILGRISMDMTIIDVGNSNAKAGDEVLIMDDASVLARIIGGSYYEIMTRTNPAIKRILV